jgi:hypothetical protein
MNTSHITLIAIDGQGRGSREYLALLESMLERGAGGEAIFFTSDSECKHSSIKCTQVPQLNYCDYSRFCVEELGAHVKTDFCLTVQLDGFMVNPDRWEDAFFEYDYIGAPWATTLKRRLPERYRVGNGGFSLRSRRLLEAAGKLRWNRDWRDFRFPVDSDDKLSWIPFRYRLGKHAWGNEDCFLAWVAREELDAKGIQFAPVEIARRFSVQHCTILDDAHTVDATLGFHGRKLFPEVRRRLEAQGLSFPYPRDS